MRSRTRFTSALMIAGLGLAVVVASGAPLEAHHPFSVEFDARKPINFTGKVVKVEWTNPHSRFHIEVVNPKTGKPEQWIIEVANPHNLYRRGFSMNAIKVGMTVKVDGYASKDGTKRANGRDLTMPDGTTLFVGSSATGAPVDGRDPTEK
jgi:hypothetical protein